MKTGIKIFLGALLIFGTLGCSSFKKVIGISNNSKAEEKEVAKKIEKEDEKVDIKLKEELMTEKNINKGYYIDGNEVVFIFDMEAKKKDIKKWLHEGTEIKIMSIAGTFNGWDRSKDWEMSKKGDNLWVLKKPVDQLDIPGNSGFPEFAFIAEGEYKKNGMTRPTEGWLKANEDVPDGYKFNDQWTYESNYLLILDPENTNFERIKEDNDKVSVIRTDFDSEYVMTNFREVAIGDITGDKLFRSYHPFISHKDQDEELKRNETIQRLMEKHGIKSIINLADDENILDDERMPKVYEDVKNNDRLLIVTSSYSTAYFESDSDEFAETMRNIVNFIINNEPPYLVHCAIGTDRTGVSTAVLAAANGATWEEIRNDYQKSNRMGMMEYRHENLLKYSIENIFDVEITDKNMTLEEEAKNYFIERLGLSEEEFEMFQKRFES